MLTYNLWKTPINTIFIRFSKYYFQHFILVNKINFEEEKISGISTREYILLKFESITCSTIKDALIWRILYFWTIFNLIASYFLRIPIHILDSVSLFKNCYMDFLKSMLEYFYMVWKIKTLDFSCFFSTHIAAEVVRPNQTFFLSLK